MKLVLTVLRWSVIGALTNAVIMALYRYYIVTSSGFVPHCTSHDATLAPSLAWQIPITRARICGRLS